MKKMLAALFVLSMLASGCLRAGAQSCRRYGVQVPFVFVGVHAQCHR